MDCPYCKAKYILKKNFIAKTCACDDEERFVPYDNWYADTFKQESLENQYSESDQLYMPLNL